MKKIRQVRSVLAFLLLFSSAPFLTWANGTMDTAHAVAQQEPRPRPSLYRIYDTILKIDDDLIYTHAYTGSGDAYAVKPEPEDVANLSQQEAVEAYIQLADAGDPIACTALGFYWDNRFNLPSAEVQQQAFKYLQSAADAHFVPAISKLAVYYYKGIGCEENEQKALSLFDSLKDTSYAHALFNYAVALEEGMYGEPDMAQAVAYYEKAASLGHSDAMNVLAHMYVTGQGIPRDVEKGIALMQQAVAAGDISAYDDLAKIFGSETSSVYDQDAMLAYRYQYRRHLSQLALERKAFARARLSHLIERGHAGDVSAQVELSDIYRGWSGILPDFEQYVYWLQKAADNGSISSCSSLAALYKNGKGVEQNLAKAFYYYKQVYYSHQDFLGEYDLARLSTLGLLGIKHGAYLYYLYEENKKNSEELWNNPWLTLSSEYYDDSGIDAIEAFTILHDLCEQQEKYKKDYAPIIAFCYAFGIGTDVDEDAAEQWGWKPVSDEVRLYHVQEYKTNFREHLLQEERLAAKQQAYKRIAEDTDDPHDWYIYAESLNRTIDHSFGEYKELFSAYKKAADGGILEACYRLAKMYEYGEGAPSDFEKMYYYTTLAACGGYNLAQQYMAEIYRSGYDRLADPEEWSTWSLISALNANSDVYANVYLDDLGLHSLYKRVKTLDRLYSYSHYDEYDDNDYDYDEDDYDYDYDDDEYEYEYDDDDYDYDDDYDDDEVQYSPEELEAAIIISPDDGDTVTTLSEVNRTSVESTVCGFFERYLADDAEWKDYILGVDAANTQATIDTLSHEDSRAFFGHFSYWIYTDTMMVYGENELAGVSAGEVSYAIGFEGSVTFPPDEDEEAYTVTMNPKTDLCHIIMHQEDGKWYVRYFPY